MDIDSKDVVMKPKEVAEVLGVSVSTIQKWDENGVFPARRTPTNRRYYLKSDCDQLKNHFQSEMSMIYVSNQVNELLTRRAQLENSSINDVIQKLLEG